jgi:NADH dehydrogenase
MNNQFQKSRIAITGGAGFIGSHLAARLKADGHDTLLIVRRKNEAAADSFIVSDLADTDLSRALVGCDSVAHCAGINREIDSQTFRRVHVEGTRNVVNACLEAGVRKIVVMSFLRARPACGSPYHESKWEAEEIVRNSGLDYTIVRAGVVYGKGDHMLDHLSHALYSFPVFAMVGFHEKMIRPVAVEDLVTILRAAIVQRRLTQKTVAVTGAEELSLSEAVRRVAKLTGNNVMMMRAPVWSHYLLAQLCEWTMKTPLVAKAQVRILSEGVTEPALSCDLLPYDLLPTRRFTDEQILRGLPNPGPFTLHDLRWCA